MAFPVDYTTLKNVRGITETSPSQELVTNLQLFLDWGLLQKYNFFNVHIPTSGAYGGNEHQLKCMNYPGYTDGSVWQSFRSNWVWESGIPSVQYQPINISGVYVNGTLQTTGYNVDYPNGRIVFNTPISTSSTVTAEYSYRWLNVYTANQQFFRQVQFDSFRLDTEDWRLMGSGIYNIFNENRIQMPAIVIEATPNTRYRPLQLGNGQIREQEVKLHIFTENLADRNTVVDILSLQNNKALYLFDVDNAGRDDRLPLNYNGDRNTPSGLQYPNLIEHYSYKTLYLKDIMGINIEPTPPLYRALIKTKIEIENYL